MKTLIDFKLQPIISTEDNKTRCYLMKDLKISQEVVGGCFKTVYKGEHVALNIKEDYLEGKILGNPLLNSCLFISYDGVEVSLEESQWLRTLLLLFTEDIKVYAKEYTVRSNWEQQESIHVTI